MDFTNIFYSLCKKSLKTKNLKDHFTTKEFRFIRCKKHFIDKNSRNDNNFKNGENGNFAHFEKAKCLEIQC